MGKRFIKGTKYLFNCILEVIYPKKDNCLICYEELENYGLCNVCRNKLIRVNNPLVQRYEEEEYTIYSCNYYTKELKKLILSFKNHKDFLAGEILQELLIEGMKHWNIRGDVITYVPLTRKKEKLRGFNQCKYLGKKLSEVYNIPLKNLLYKDKRVKEQKKLTRIERQKNVERAFFVQDSEKVKNKRIILIDDVVTTGFTLLSCANELKKFGAKEVIILTVAQSKL